MKYYAVKAGRQTGIYESWADCQQQILGYSGAAFKSFEKLEDAQQYMNQQEQAQEINTALPTAYIDGSYSQKRGLYGYGGFIRCGERTSILSGTGNNPEYLPERNIAGELLGTLQVLHYCLREHIPEVNIYYDYSGIEKYITGEWKAQTKLAKYYAGTVDLLSMDIRPHFIKVAGHTGIEGNEMADYLAKEAVGAQLRKKDIAAVAAFKAAAGQA